MSDPTAHGGDLGQQAEQPHASGPPIGHYLDTAPATDTLAASELAPTEALRRLTAGVRKPTKAARRAAQRERYLAGRDERRRLERERRKANRRKRALSGAAPPAVPNKRQRRTVRQIAIDLSYQELMSAKELASLSSQLVHAYGTNLRQPAPWRMLWTACDGALAALLERHGGHEHWRVERTCAPLAAVVPVERCVMLTADSPNVLEALDADDTYVIGGIVDHNRYPRLTLQRAESAGMRHARLPLDALRPQKRVLTVNHTVDVLLRVAAGATWDAALAASLPARIQRPAPGSDAEPHSGNDSGGGRGGSDGGSDGSDNDGDDNDGDNDDGDAHNGADFAHSDPHRDRDGDGADAEPPSDE